MIPLTDITGKTIYLNRNHIVALEPVFYKQVAATRVHIGPADDDFFVVLDEPGRILQMIEKEEQNVRNT